MGRRAEQIDPKTIEIIIAAEDAEDPRIAWGHLKQRIDTLRETGCEVPLALLTAERQLMMELMAQSQGR